MKLRIGLLCHRGVGGSTRIAVELGDALASRGHAVHLFARSRPLGRPQFRPGVTFHPLVEGDGHAPASAELDADWSPDDVKMLADRVSGVVSGWGLDVLHFHYAVPFARVAWEVRRRAGSRAPAVVGTLHGTDVLARERSAVAAGLARVLSETDALTTVSRSHVGLVRTTFRLPTPPELVPNFVDLCRFRPRPRGARPTRRPRIVHVSNFRPVKNPGAVARVFALVRRHIDAELWLVGAGEGMPSVVSTVKRSGLENDVRFFGLHPAVESVLPHADVLLMTSRAESFGLAALEAGACGVPTVGPRIGGLPEVVVDGRTGLLFDAGDEEAAARAVLRLLSDHRSRSLMGRSAVRRAAVFSRETVVSRYERIYRRLVDGS